MGWGFNKYGRALLAWGEDIVKTSKKLGKDDPRRVIHSLKVGLALTLISLYYYFQPLYDGFGLDAMWAVLTVLLVFEFSVGGTIGKLVNRIGGTLLAGALALGLHRLAILLGEVGQIVMLVISVFSIGAMITFLRFFPAMKARYDYGLLIFLLTFCVVTVSGYGELEVFEIVYHRLSTVIIGSFVALSVCIFIFLVWIGTDLHNFVANNLEKLALILDGFGDEYFATIENNGEKNDKCYYVDRYKSVLNSKATEETMANLARWEPCHRRFMWSHPWNQYLKVGALTRQCAYQLQALHGYLDSDLFQACTEIQMKIKEPCKIICSECGKALKELAAAIKGHYLSTSPSSEIKTAKTAIENLNSIMKTQSLWEDLDEQVLKIIPNVFEVSSQLMSVASCVQDIEEAVVELASLAHFKSAVVHGDSVDPTTQDHQHQHVLHLGVVIPIVEESDDHHHVIYNPLN
ncbi:aluminum-activated malate transporter 8-like [Humulus lupulus]|uniref:aluminum-activated malate transporter 8-like n=1 Tax=Humulus lupulus TaxID=3486 RepID=UPI002B407CF8|nr:aluminum-activated malate transporter 8-like [Humulus lupulus]